MNSKFWTGPFPIARMISTYGILVYFMIDRQTQFLNPASATQHVVMNTAGIDLMQFSGCGTRNIILSTLEMASSVSQHFILLFVCLSLGKSPLSFVVDFSMFSCMVFVSVHVSSSKIPLLTHIHINTHTQAHTHTHTHTYTHTHMHARMYACTHAYTILFYFDL